MGTMHYETLAASAAFVNALIDSGRLGRMLHNGGDIVLFQTDAGDTISAHFIDSALPLYEIRNVLADNQSRGIATLYLLWADMMLPADGQVYYADDWMEGLYSLYGDSIYAYEIFQEDAFVFPVHFRGGGPRRQAEFGGTVQYSRLATRRVKTYLPGLQGDWLVADFGGRSGVEHDALRSTAEQDETTADLALLGLEPGATLAEVKTAYRHLARRMHPDANPAADAHDTMMELNAAYARLLERLET